MVYAIYEEFLPDVEKKLNRIGKKCIKHGNDFTYEIIGSEIREEVSEDGTKEYFKFILIEVEGTAKIDNWECIAVMDVHEVGNVIRRINTEIEVPNRFKTSENICEHCNSKRNRKNLFIIHNVETDEWKQVGGDCLMLYTNGLNAEYVASYMDGILYLEEYDGMSSGGRKAYFSVENVLSYAVEVIGKTGYFNSQSSLPTKSLVAKFFIERDLTTAIMACNKDFMDAKVDMWFKKSDFIKPDTDSTVEKIIEYYTNLEDDSEFVHNIKVMLAEKYIQFKDFGFICYLPEGYAKHLQREIERAKRLEEKNEHFGEVGKRYKDMKIVNFKHLTMWETIYGMTYLHQITLEDGYVLVWKTSNGVYLEDNQMYDKITFTVKEHGEYKGMKQTEVTRCKITFKDAE